MNKIDFTDTRWTDEVLAFMERQNLTIRELAYYLDYSYQYTLNQIYARTRPSRPFMASLITLMSGMENSDFVIDNKGYIYPTLVQGHRSEVMRHKTHMPRGIFMN